MQKWTELSNRDAFLSAFIHLFHSVLLWIYQCWIVAVTLLVSLCALLQSLLLLLPPPSLPHHPNTSPCRSNAAFGKIATTVQHNEAELTFEPLTVILNWQQIDYHEEPIGFVQRIWGEKTTQKTATEISCNGKWLTFSQSYSYAIWSSFLFARQKKRKFRLCDIIYVDISESHEKRALVLTTFRHL